MENLKRNQNTEWLIWRQFLQFYGVDNRFVAEMHIKYANDDFRTFSFINKEKLFNKSVLITGATGLICSAIVDIIRYLNESENAQITVYSKSSTNSTIPDEPKNSLFILNMSYNIQRPHPTSAKYIATANCPSG